MREMEILHITVHEMHHNNMSTGSSLWHFLYRLVHKSIGSVISSEKQVATTKYVLAETGTNQKTCYYDAFREWR